MKKRVLAIILAMLLIVLSACTSAGNNNVSQTYDEALDLMKQEKYAEASEKLSAITYYLDSVQLSLYCRAHAWAAEEKYKDAISELQKLSGFRDAYQAAAYFDARWSESTAKSPMTRANAANQYDEQTINGYRDSSVRSAKIRAALYQDGLNAEKAENWAEAAECFEALENYEDSKTRFYYTAGRMYEAEGEKKAVSYAFATVHFNKAGKYQDAAEREAKCLETSYARADEKIKAEEFNGAREIYDALENLCDKEKYAQLDEAIAIALEKARQRHIAEADALLAEEKFDEAYAIYVECDEPEMACEAMYLKAAWLDRNEKPEEAGKVYMSIVSYKDSRGKHYLLGKARMESDPETASHILLDDREFPGAADDLYAIARAATDAKNYPLSITVYGEFAGTRDCTLRMMNDLYLYGRQLLEGDEPEHAAEVFDRLKGVGSADLYANMARYAAAEALEKKGRYETAAKSFDAIADYADAADRADECRYKLAVEKKKNGLYDDAREIFAKLGNRKDSVEQEKDCRYLLAGQYAGKSLWEDAIALYEGLEDYSESKVKCAECYRNLGWRQMGDGEVEEAYHSFVSAGDEDDQKQAAYATGEKYTAAVQLDTAIRWYRLASELPETEERTIMIAQSLLNMEEDSLSESYASVVPDSEKAQDVLYALALRSLEHKDEEAAMRQMKKAGDNADASERFQAMLSARVEALVAEERFDDAVFLCSTYGEQEKADEIRGLKAQKEEEERQKAIEAEKAEHEAKKQEAGALLDAEKFEEAAALFAEIGEKELAENALSKKAEAEAALRAEEEAARAEAEKAEREKIKAREDEAAALLAAGSFDDAITIYDELNEPEMINEATYQKAAVLDQPDLYLEIPEYKDSREKHYQAGKALLNSDPEKAFRILADDVTYGDVQSVLYELAGKESENGHFLLSSAIYEKLGSQPLDPQDPRPDCKMRSIQDMYRYGMQLKEQGDWETAAAIFDQLDGIGEAAEHSHESYYSIAAALEGNGKYSQAAVAFEALGDYSDAPERAKQSRYNAAMKQLESGAYDSAEVAFVELRGFSNAAEMSKNCRYQKANTLFAGGKYEEARDIYEKLGDYQTSAEMTQECTYQIAEQLLGKTQYTEAISQYEKIKGYNDAEEKLKTCHSAIGDKNVRKANELLQKGDTAKAAESYKTAYTEYQKADDTEKVNMAAMRIAECYQSVNDLDNAITWLMKAKKASNTIPTLEKIAAYYEMTEQKEKAESVRQVILWIRAENAMEDKDYLTAIEYYGQITDPEILKEGAKEAYYYYGLGLMNEGKYREAVDAFTTAEDYLDASEHLKSAWIGVGNKELEAGNYQEARDAFAKVDAKEFILDAWNQEAEAYLAKKQYDDAKIAFINAENDTRYKDTVFEEAKDLTEKERYEEAYKLYTSIIDREGVKEIIETNNNLSQFLLNIDTEKLAITSCLIFDLGATVMVSITLDNANTYEGIDKVIVEFYLSEDGKTAASDVYSLECGVKWQKQRSILSSEYVKFNGSPKGIFARISEIYTIDGRVKKLDDKFVLFSR